MTFLSNNEEKKAFLTIILNVIMIDGHRKEEEKIILKNLELLFNIENLDSYSLYGLDEKDKTHAIKKIIVEVNKIKSVIPIVYLFNILFELKKYNNTVYNFDKTIYQILDKVDAKEYILNSKLFLYTAVEKSQVKDSANQIKGDRVDGVFEGFKKLFK